MAVMSAVNIAEAFTRFYEHWSPKIIGQVNDFHVKAVKVQGEFVWHSHPETDELFWVHKGELFIDYRDRRNTVRAGEFFVVPRGTEHRPCALAECEMLLIEPASTVNTGDAAGVQPTAAVWLNPASAERS